MILEDQRTHKLFLGSIDKRFSNWGRGGKDQTDQTRNILDEYLSTVNCRLSRTNHSKHETERNGGVKNNDYYNPGHNILKPFDTF